MSTRPSRVPGAIAARRVAGRACRRSAVVGLPAPVERQPPATPPSSPSASHHSSKGQAEPVAGTAEVGTSPTRSISRPSVAPTTVPRPPRRRPRPDAQGCRSAAATSFPPPRGSPSCRHASARARSPAAARTAGRRPARSGTGPRGTARRAAQRRAGSRPSPAGRPTRPRPAKPHSAGHSAGDERGGPGPVRFGGPGTGPAASASPVSAWPTCRSRIAAAGPAAHRSQVSDRWRATRRCPVDPVGRCAGREQAEPARVAVVGEQLCGGLRRRAR